jgi:hypothetical protein
VKTRCHVVICNIAITGVFDGRVKKTEGHAITLDITGTSIFDGGGIKKKGNAISIPFRVLLCCQGLSVLLCA